ncbi:MAG: hypothetical protein Q9163_000551 [Psora crenata]
MLDMKGSLLLVVGFLSFTSSLAQAASTVTISVNTATDCPAAPSANGAGAAGNGGSGSNGGVPNSTTPGVESTIESSYGSYDFYGFYPLIPSQNILNGQVTTSNSMTLERCASDCQGSPFFAVDNGKYQPSHLFQHLQLTHVGNECTCGTAAPAGQPVYDPINSTPCPGNAAESCGSPGYAIIYRRGAAESGSTTIVYTSTNPNGQVTTSTATSFYSNSSPSGVTTIVYTSTNSVGQVTTGTTTSTLLANPSPEVATYTSTGPGGQVTTITTTSTPLANPSPGVATYTSTGPGGQVTTITTTSPSSSQAISALASVVTKTSTDAQGSIYTTTQTTVNTPTSSSALCPGANGQSYSTGGSIYEISCGTDYPGDDLIAVHTDSLPDCLLACSNYVPQPAVAGGQSCVAVSWGQGNPGGNCYLKYNIEVVNPFDGGIVSGREVTFQPANPPRTISAGSAQGGSSTSPLPAQNSISSVPNNGGASVTASSPDASSTNTAGPVGGSSSANGVTGDSSTSTFDNLSISTSLGITSQLAGASSTTGGGSDNSLSSSASSTETSAPTGGSSSGSSGGPSTSTFDNLPPSPSLSIISQPAGATSTTGGGSEGSSLLSISSTETSAPAGGSSSAIDSSGGSSTPTSDGLSSSTSPNTNPTSNARYPCPDLDNQQYLLGTSADIYTVRCDVNYPGNDLITPHYDNFDDCITACDSYTPNPAVAGGAGCVAVSWGEGNVGGNCYLKYAIGQVDTNNAGFDSAQTLIYIPPSVSTTALSSSSSASPPLTSAISSPAGGSAVPTDAPALPPSAGSALSSSSTDNAVTTNSPSSSTAEAASSSPIGGQSSSAAPTSAAGGSGSPSTSSSGPSTVYTPISSSPACPQNNNALYTDVLGVQYNINCGINVDGDNSQALHADTFTECILYCDMYAGCAGVTYADGNNANPATNTNCYPYSKFRNYSSQALQNALYVAVPAAGPNNATDFQDNLCTDTAYGDGSTYIGVFGTAFQIGCGKNLDGSQLACMATDTLEACADYCSLYDGCVAVTFTGNGPPGPNQCNCNPLSTVGTSSISLNVGYAIKQ